ncbi:hypothetical protein Tdes44962_MAKER06804 [Teratosphaeria destructans]|uniref:BTB domain-containing protein n=1 Tax=Teratosphaeria destructans TaxID=418781 RepID=A0A9W7T0D5_9PEZI|nr:hypothetical protein Tdes44962_MAKER06804 [Teratosphaeria destructans]
MLFCDSSLKSDSFVKIFLGDAVGQQPYLVARSILEDSAEYFRKALQHAPSFGAGELDVLRFPEDDTGAWEVLLYWMLKGSLTALKSLQECCYGDNLYRRGLLVHCWCLGDKYGMDAFQNEIMVHLILVFEDQCIPPAALRDAFENTAPGSRLRKICMEELVLSFNQGGTGSEELELFDGIVGFISEFSTTMQDESLKHSVFRTLCRRKHQPGEACHKARDAWKTYMVGDSPAVHRLEAVINKHYAENDRSRCYRSPL